jgi:hypothetical protein
MGVHAVSVGSHAGRHNAEGMVRDAEISVDGRYRWWLSRQWAPADPWVHFVMLNPSTADWRTDDPKVQDVVASIREQNKARRRW